MITLQDLRNGDQAQATDAGPSGTRRRPERREQSEHALRCNSAHKYKLNAAHKRQLAERLLQRVPMVYLLDLQELATISADDCDYPYRVGRPGGGEFYHRSSRTRIARPDDVLLHPYWSTML